MTEPSKKNPGGASCASCKFGISFTDFAGEEATLEQRLAKGGDNERIVCRRNAPTVNYLFMGIDQATRQPAISSRSGFPTIGAGGWCGEYQAGIVIEITHNPSATRSN
jgi:hypothetical protein